MKSDPSISRALFGSELEGDKAVRFIYIDEAGISANEPVTVVVGIIVDADKYWRLAEAKMNQLLEDVPECFRQGFIFHAATISGSKKYHEKWAKNDRLAFLQEMMSIPKQLNLPISLGIAHRNAPFPTTHALPKMAKEKLQHMMAFYMCMHRADVYLRIRAGQNEVATIVAEDVPSMRRFLRMSLELVRDDPTLLEHAIDPKEHVSRIIDTVHFAEKSHGPLLQIADACAYGFRRYFSKQKHGNDFVKSILGEPSNMEAYFYPSCGGSLFAFNSG